MILASVTGTISECALTESEPECWCSWSWWSGPRLRRPQALPGPGPAQPEPECRLCSCPGRGHPLRATASPRARPGYQWNFILNLLKHYLTKPTGPPHHAIREQSTRQTDTHDRLPARLMNSWLLFIWNPNHMFPLLCNMLIICLSYEYIVHCIRFISLVILSKPCHNQTEKRYT